MTIKEGSIVHHKALTKRRGPENSPEFAVREIYKEEEKAKLELLTTTNPPFNIVGKTWDNIPLDNLTGRRLKNE